ncbi:hypothetical protein K438DRAFT_1772731 [Mycena galopus ATCC 62051]|nr:hypothetical protein K438DRAFT_1772731 [Mycena galopus ATCC 62051]
MALFHATVPSVKHSKSEAFRPKIQDAGPSAEDPPSKHNLEAELRHQSCGWTLNEWDIPVCEEDAECSICESYTDHFLARLSRADTDSADSADEAQGGSSAEDEELGRKDSASPGSDSELEEVQEKSVLMKKLLRLRDLRARERSYKSEDPNNLQGMMVALNFDKLRAEADRDTANSRWSMVEMEKDTLQASLQTLTQVHDELQTHHKAALDELQVLKQRLSKLTESALAAMSAIPTSPPMAAEPAITMSAPVSTSAVFTILPFAGSPIPTSAPILTPTIPTLSHAEWLAMKMPHPSAAPQLLACWLQFQEHAGLRGVHVCGPHWDVDLRDLRGYKEIMSRVPEMRKNSGCTDRRDRQRCILAILDVLALPHRYSELLSADRCAVATEVRYYPLSLQQGQQDLAVSRLLAAQGLTVAVADDAWQYAYRYIKSIAEDRSVRNATTDAARNLLANIEARLRDGPPPGLKSEEEDRFRRPSHLPNKRLRNSLPR